MNALLIVLALQSLCGVGFSWQYPRNADQTLWAFRTCQREVSDQALLPKIYKWELPDNADTHCYVKCVWMNLGSYDFNSKSINVDTIATQYETRGLTVPADLENLKGATDGSCEAVYKKTIDFFLKEKDNLQHAYYGTIPESNKWFAQHPDVKPKRTRISEFCTGKEGGKEGSCKHACSMYYYRLVDEDNLVIPFRKLKMNGTPEEAFDGCRKDASKETGCKVGDVLYDCINALNSDGFQAVLKRWDDETDSTY
uniref:27 kDa salivary D7-related protein SP10 n=1 Tax=Phlebotomus argentipes TaxID=94469 RepID=Q0ZSU0_PHLAR|nr:27 kDa salivary D7-related protein SP10 [Phlebotomus argentipes]